MINFVKHDEIFLAEKNVSFNLSFKLINLFQLLRQDGA